MDGRKTGVNPARPGGRQTLLCEKWWLDLGQWLWGESDGFEVVRREPRELLTASML